MARVKFHLHNKPTADGRRHIKISVAHNNSRATITTGVFVRPEQWFAGDTETYPYIKKTCPGAKAMNEIINEKLEAVRERVNALVLDGSMRSFETATALKNHIQAALDGKTTSHGSVQKQFLSFIDRRKAPRTKGAYRETLTKIGKYHDIDMLSFGEITAGWLKNFESKMRRDGLGVNSIGRHMRELRAVYNDAIDDGTASLNDYPFRRFKIKSEKPASRALTVEQLRQLRDWKCEPFQEKYRDIFMLIFYLGGINIIDLSLLTDMPGGRIEYSRHKTGVFVSLAVQPEAIEIIDRYRGRERLISIFEENKNHGDFLHRMDKELKRIGPWEMVTNAATNPAQRKCNKKKITPLFPKLSSYWARHTAATLMAEVDIPDPTIDMILAHADNSMAGRYIRRNQQKADEAIRRVIDFLNEE